MKTRVIAARVAQAASGATRLLDAAAAGATPQRRAVPRRGIRHLSLRQIRPVMLK